MRIGQTIQEESMLKDFTAFIELTLNETVS